MEGDAAAAAPPPAVEAVDASHQPMYGRRGQGDPSAHPYATSPGRGGLAGVDKSGPAWRLPVKKRSELSERLTRGELGKGLAAFQEAPAPVGGGLKCFPEKKGVETDWKIGLKLVPPPLVEDRSMGKRFGYCIEDGGEIRLPRKAQFKLADTGHQTKIFQKKANTVDASGNLVQCQRSKEASHESMMTRKRVCHDLQQQRGGLPLATYGDKAYAEPSYAPGYWKDAASTVPKCGVHPRDRRHLQKRLPALREREEHLRLEKAEVAAIPSLPQGAPRYDIKVKLPRKELDDLVARCLNFDRGEVTVLRPPSELAAQSFSAAGVTKGRGDRSDPLSYARSEFPLCLLRLNGVAVDSEASVKEALKGAPATEVEIMCGHETGDAGLDSD
eukprot:Hpha_TRINITY_DN10713_c0_g1::TRINITY_DN10713_c0_g1_i1::g.43427::m.43427